MDAELLDQALKSIIVLNREMGTVMESIKWLTFLAQGQLYLLGTLIVVNLSNMFLIRRNGKRR